MTKRETILIYILVGLVMFVTSGCGRKASHEAVNEPKDEHCVIVDGTLMCPDGTEIFIPEEPADDVTHVIVEVIIEITPEVEDEPDVHCEPNNKNGRKCKKIKERKKS